MNFDGSKIGNSKFDFRIALLDSTTHTLLQGNQLNLKGK